VLSYSGLESTYSTDDLLLRRKLNKELEELVLVPGITEQVHFHGFIDRPHEWMARRDFLIFPSFDEGLGLVLMQAIQVGLPALASDIKPLRELVGDDACLLPAREAAYWRSVHESFLAGDSFPHAFDQSSAPADHEMAVMTGNFYEKVLVC